MTEGKRIGFFLCHCGGNISNAVNIEAVKEYASSLDGVETVYDYAFVCSETGQATIKERIREHNLDRVVIASCSPKFHEPTFRRTIALGGLNPYFLAIANVREQCSFPHSHFPEQATAKAKDLVAAAVARAKNLEPILKKRQVMNKDVLVIGAGIAGIQTSLELARAGFMVYLIEKSPVVGGHVPRLFKTFPFNEKAVANILPLMEEAATHKNIRILTYSEVKALDGTLGNFEVKVVKKPRFVDERLCNGCGECTGQCPAGAIHIPEGPGLPKIATIDSKSCAGLTEEGCEVCQKVCPLRAIDLEQKEVEIVLYVGAIVVATGFEEYDPTPKQNLGYGRYPNVITQLELARMLTQGKVVRPSDGQAPKNVVMVQCVGSRDDQATGHPYCSRICCMVASKHSTLLKENNVKTTICYIDVRAFGKGYEEYYKEAQARGVRYIRGKVAEIQEKGNGDLIVRVENTLTQEVRELPADLVVLSAAIEPGKGTKEMFEVLGIGKDETDFVKEFHPKLRPCDTSIEGIFVAGCAQGPKDISDSTAQALGAAARVEVLLSGDIAEISLEKAVSDPEMCQGCKICEKLCIFEAISMIETPDGRNAHVEETLCQGCGVCAGACPTGAMQLRHYTDSQVVAEVEALLAGS